MGIKKILIGAFLGLCIAGLAQAQETYSIAVGGTPTNRASVVGQIDLGRIQHNEDVCTRAALPATCTQAQACVALGIAGGSSCTAASALAAEARIYANTLAGREAFVVSEMIRFRAPIYVIEQKAREEQVLKTWCVAANATNLNQLCTLIGLSNGCTPCGN